MRIGFQSTVLSEICAVLIFLDLFFFFFSSGRTVFQS